MTKNRRGSVACIAQNKLLSHNYNVPTNYDDNI
jgi:hypothetical protein